MLSLAGYDLSLDNPDGDIRKFINNFLPDERTTLLAMPWNRRAFPGYGITGLAQPAGFMPEPQFKINRFYWPTLASRWAYGHFLADSDTTGLIVQAGLSSLSPTPITLSIGNPESNSQGTIVAGETVNTQVTLLAYTPLSGIRGLSGPITSLYLLTVVDQRFYWWYKNFGAISIISSTQWTDLIDQCASAIGLSGQIVVDPISSGYLQPSVQAWSLPYEPIPPILDAIAFNLGMRVSVDYNGTVRMMKYSTALTKLNNDMSSNSNRVILAGGQKFPPTL